MSTMTDYFENKLIDQVFRGQSYTFPSTLYFGLLTSGPTDASVGTEVTGGAYERIAVSASMAQFAGTQAAGSTIASSGVTGTTSNNNVIAYAAPTANWGAVTHMAVYDALTGGNMLFYGALANPKTINNGDAAPSYAAGAFIFQLDN